MNPLESCLICDQKPVKESDVFYDPDSFSYIFDICGHLFLKEEAAVKIKYKLKPEEKIRLGIGLRNEYENRNCKKYSKPFNIEQIELLVNRSGNLDPLSKIDNTLINLNKKSEFEGQKIHIDIHKDYFYYHCRTPGEVIPLFKIIDVEDKIGAKRKD